MLFIVLLVILYYCCFLLGDFFVSYDYFVYFFNGWLISDVLLFSGCFSGWIDLWFVGYFVNEFYGLGGNLWISVMCFMIFG